VQGGREREQNRGRERRGQVDRWIPDEISATIVDHVVNHGLKWLRLVVGRTTVNSIIQKFRLGTGMYKWTVIQH